MRTEFSRSRQRSHFADKFSAHIGFLFKEIPFEARFAAARRAGFSAIEHPSPFLFSAKQIFQLLNSEGLRYIQFAFPAGDPAKGEKGFAALTVHQQRFRA